MDSLRSSEDGAWMLPPISRRGLSNPPRHTPHVPSTVTIDNISLDRDFRTPEPLSPLSVYLDAVETIDSPLEADDGNPSNSTKHVPLEHFDPPGVEELRRSLSRTSLKEKPTTSAASASRGCDSLAMTEGTELDFEKVLRQTIEQRDAEDIPSRSLGVLFKNLKVTTTVSSAHDQPTLLSTICPLQIFHRYRNSRRLGTRDVLSEFEGVVRPGEMLLVLGRPSSGCSTLLKILANQASQYHSVSGERYYDSFHPDDVERSYRGDVIYCPEDDVHFPTLTVKETLTFAAKTRAPRVRVGRATRLQYVESVTDVLMTVFGLKQVAHSLVGDARVRGVTNGEKKRVSICEALATRSRLCAWDNPTRGLDAHAALEFVRALRIATDLGRLTTIVSMYQASDAQYKHFDKVCVINEGKMVFFGQTSDARAYFEGLGYQPINRQPTPDFLVAVTDRDARVVNPDQRGPLPRTAEEFAWAFRNSVFGQSNHEDMEDYRCRFVGKSEVADAYQRSTDADRADHTDPSSPFTISLPMQLRAVLIRRLQILKGDKEGQAYRALAEVVQAILIGVVFFQESDSTSLYFSRQSVLYYALMHSTFSAMTGMSSIFSQRSILLRHAQAAMYRPSVDALAHFLVDIPVTVLAQTIFAVILYYLVGLQRSSGQFFMFLYLLVTTSFTMRVFFHMLSNAFKRESTATTLGGVLALVFSLYSGYFIPRSDMVGALKWITYVNPLRYGYEAILTNEFHSLSGLCSNIAPRGSGYADVGLARQSCVEVGSLSGQPTVDGNRFLQASFGFAYDKLALNAGIIVVFTSLFLGVLLVLVEAQIRVARDTAMTLFSCTDTCEVITPQVRNVDEESASTEIGNLLATCQDIKYPPINRTTGPDLLTWRHVEYRVPFEGGGQRRVLDDVCGYIIPGKLTAIVGETGAGKTALLNVLSGRYATGTVMGGRFINGQPFPEDICAQTGYDQREIIIVPKQSVREALLFSAKLRRPKSVLLSEKIAHVETCLKLCGLEALGDAIVGTLSRELQRRTAIASELAAKPRLLFLDDPTAGLDPQSSWAIMRLLRSLADAQQAILCTINQASAQVFQVLDQILVLRKGGQTVYFGDLGRDGRTVIGYFEENGACKCRSGENLAQWMADVVGGKNVASGSIDWHDVWLNSNESICVQEQIDALHAKGRTRPEVKMAPISTFATSWPYQLRELVIRIARGYWRSPGYILWKLALNIVAGLFVGFTFFKSRDTIRGVQNHIFSVFISLLAAVPLAKYTQVSFLQARGVFDKRERNIGLYSWSAMIMSQLLVELPGNMIGSCFYFVTWYWSSGYPASRAGYTFIMLALIFSAYVTTLAQVTAVLASGPTTAFLLFNILYFFSMAFNGVMQPFSELDWWQWMYRVSPLTYVVEGVLGYTLSGKELACASAELTIIEPPSGDTCSRYLANFIASAGGYVTNPDATAGCEFCPFRSVDVLLQSRFNIYASNRWRNVGILCGVVAFNIVAMFAFMLFRVRRRKLFSSLSASLGSGI